MKPTIKLGWKQFLAFTGLLAISPANTVAQQPPFLPERVIADLAQELSGETAKSNLEYLTRLHRMRGSRDFHAAAEFVAERARAAGLTDARVEQFPADGDKLLCDYFVMPYNLDKAKEQFKQTTTHNPQPTTHDPRIFTFPSPDKPRCGCFP